MAIKSNQENMESKMAGIVGNVDRNRKANEKPGALVMKTIRVPENHWDSLREIAETEGVKISDLIRKAIKEIIETH